MKALIDLYYSFASIKGDDLQTPDTENLLKVFFGDIFGYCGRGGENEKFRFRLYHSKEVKEDLTVLNKRGIGPAKYDHSTGIAIIRTFMKEVSVGEDELITFRGLMDTLRETIERKEVYHFDISGFRDEIDTGFEGIDHDDATPQNDFQDKPFKNFSEETERMAVDSLRTGMPSQQKIGDIDVITTHYRIITVHPFSEFGKKVLFSTPQEDTLSEIPHINSPSCYRFIQIIRSLFVLYQMAFDSYDRIKLCKYCNKLFFEKKKGAAIFCSSRCRKKDYDDHYPREKRLCKENQNAWIRNKFGKEAVQVYNVGKDDCITCGNPLGKGGKCPVIRDKNKERLAN